MMIRIPLIESIERLRCKMKHHEQLNSVLKCPYWASEIDSIDEVYDVVCAVEQGLQELEVF